MKNLISCDKTTIATLGSKAREIAQLLGWSAATVHFIHSRFAKEGEAIGQFVHANLVPIRCRSGSYSLDTSGGLIQFPYGQNNLHHRIRGDIKNLFVSDGDQFTSASAANPTLTIVALAIRQAEYIAQSLTRREILGRAALRLCRRLHRLLCAAKIGAFYTRLY